MARSVRRTAVVAGSTGLVGAVLVTRLLDEPSYRRIVALSRRPQGAVDARLTVIEVGYDRLPEALRGVARQGEWLDAFCCLGTTIRAAGSREAFRRVDHDYVLGFARWALDAGARRLVVISAAGADPGSRIFYSRTKGETEQALAALGLPSLVIVRPSLLDGSRTEFRLGERLALAAARPLQSLLPASVRPLSAADVAQAMTDAALADAPPAFIESAAMQGAARRSAG